MSSSLVWEPLIDPDPDRGLSTRLKFALRKRYGEPVRREFGADDLPYLEGLLDGGLQDAEPLIKAIQEFGRVFVREEY